MNALAVLVLLLFFIVLALSLTVWAAISLGTRRRGPVSADEPARARQPRQAREAPVAAQQAAAAPKAERAAEARRDDQRAGRGGRGEPSAQRQRDAAEQPWLRPQVVVERQEAQEPAAERARQRQPRVVNTDAGNHGRAKADAAAVVNTAAAVKTPAPAQQPARATVTPRAVERDAFDRFLDAEKRRN